MPVPEVRYTRRGRGAIAYQEWGTPGPDLLILSEWAANSDSVWEHPGHIRMWRFHGSFARTARFDRSGIGSSDPPDGDLADPAVWAADALAVLDATGMNRAVIGGEAWGGHAALHLAVAHPERVERLVLVNSYARMTRGADYPHGISERGVERMVELVRELWGTGQVIAQSVPNLGVDFLDYAGRYERAAASPGEAADMVRAEMTSDVTQLLEQVQCPTLVVYSGDDRYIGEEHSHFLAEHIPGAELMVMGGDTYYELDSSFGRRYIEFFTGESQPVWGDRELAAVVFSDIVQSTPQLTRVGDHDWKLVLENCDDIVDREATRLGGRVVKQTGDGHVLTFPSPGAAIAAVLGIRRAAHALGLTLRFGVHMGEIEVRADGDIAGIVVHTAARVMGIASDDEVLVTRVVNDLVAGTGLALDDRGSHQLKGLDAPMQVFAVVT